MCCKRRHRMGVMRTVELSLSSRLNTRAGVCYRRIHPVDTSNNCHTAVQFEPAWRSQTIELAALASLSIIKTGAALTLLERCVMARH